MMIKKQNKLYGNFVEFSSLLVFQGCPNKVSPCLGRGCIHARELPSSLNDSPFLWKNRCSVKQFYHITDGKKLSFTSCCSFTGFKGLKAWVETLVDVPQLPPPQDHWYSTEGKDLDNLVVNEAKSLAFPKNSSNKAVCAVAAVNQCGNMHVQNFSLESWVTPWRWLLWLQDVNFFTLIKCLCSLHSANVSALISPPVLLPSAVLAQCWVLWWHFPHWIYGVRHCGVCAELLLKFCVYFLRQMPHLVWYVNFRI